MTNLRNSKKARITTIIVLIIIAVVLYLIL